MRVGSIKFCFRNLDVGFPSHLVFFSYLLYFWSFFFTVIFIVPKLFGKSDFDPFLTRYNDSQQVTQLSQKDRAAGWVGKGR